MAQGVKKQTPESKKGGVSMILQSFTIHCIPPTTTAQQKGAFVVNNRVRFFKKKKTQQAEASLIDLLKSYVPEKPHEGALKVCITFVYPFRKSEKKADMIAGEMCHTSRPDFDNLSKMFCDVMTTLCFWRDDGQISDGRIIKRRGITTCISVVIQQDSVEVQ